MLLHWQGSWREQAPSQTVGEGWRLQTLLATQACASVSWTVAYVSAIQTCPAREAGGTVCTLCPRTPARLGLVYIQHRALGTLSLPGLILTVSTFLVMN